MLNVGGWLLAAPKAKGQRLKAKSQKLNANCFDGMMI